MTERWLEDNRYSFKWSCITTIVYKKQPNGRQESGRCWRFVLLETRSALGSFRLGRVVDAVLIWVYALRSCLKSKFVFNTHISQSCFFGFLPKPHRLQAIFTKSWARRSFFPHQVTLWNLSPSSVASRPFSRTPQPYNLTIILFTAHSFAMKFSLSASTVFSAVLLASSASAAPLVPSAGFLGSRATNAPAAAYCKFLRLSSWISLVYSSNFSYD